MKATKQQKDRVKKLTAEFDEFFSISNFERSFMWMEEDHEDLVAADISVNFEYQRVHIRIYPCFWKEDRDTQRKMILHEFCHILLKRIQTVTEDLLAGKLRTENDKQSAIEECTSRITHLLDLQLSGYRRGVRTAYADYLK
jgi:hypothetical protein